MRDDSHALLLGFELDGQGGGRELQWEDVQDVPGDSKQRWIHLNGRHEEAIAWLQRYFVAEPWLTENMLAEETRPRFMEYEQGSLLILRGMNLNDQAEPEDMVSIRLWVTQGLVISVRFRQLKAVRDIEERVLKGLGPKHIGEVVVQLAARLFQRMEPVLQSLDDQVDSIEEQVSEEADIDQRDALVSARRQAIIFKRYISPQRDAMSALRMAELDWLDAKLKRQVQELYDRLLRYVEDLDALRERAQIVHEEIRTQMSDKLNRNMYLLSIVAAIFLPLGFLTGLLGINVGGMPGADNPEAFWVFSGLLVLLVVVQLVWFRRQKFI